MSTEQTHYPLTFVSSFEELLTAMESDDPSRTKVDAFELPRTKNLNQQFVIAFSGPEASEIGGFIYGHAGALLTRLQNSKDRQPQG